MPCLRELCGSGSSGPQHQRAASQHAALTAPQWTHGRGHGQGIQCLVTCLSTIIGRALPALCMYARPPHPCIWWPWLVISQARVWSCRAHTRARMHVVQQHFTHVKQAPAHPTSRVYQPTRRPIGPPCAIRIHAPLSFSLPHCTMHTSLLTPTYVRRPHASYGAMPPSSSCHDAIMP